MLVQLKLLVSYNYPTKAVQAIDPAKWDRKREKKVE